MMSTTTRRKASLCSARGRFGAIGLKPFLASLVILSLGGSPAGAATPAKVPTLVSPPARRWTLLDRAIVQDGGDWRVDYRLRLESEAPVTLRPTDLGASADGWVSNSGVSVHAVPRRSNPRIDGAAGLASASADLIRHADENKACRERLVLRAWAAESPEPPHRPKDAPSNVPDTLVGATVAPGGSLRVRLRLEHDHFLYGPYDPLLGLREIELKLGDTTLRDVLPTDRLHHLAQARDAWPAIPEDRRDTRHFISGPDSLHLEAHIPGNQYYRFPERQVRYGTRHRLTFWYLTAPGGDPSGEFRLRLAQYKKTASNWLILSEGAVEETYSVVGKWTKVEKIVAIQPEATEAAIEFKIYGADVGEVWIDDVKFEPIGSGSEGP